MTYRALVLIGLLSAVFACRHIEDAPKGGRQSDIDLLRALPYLDASAEPAEGESGVQYWDPERAFHGFSLYSVHKDCSAELIDMAGDVLRSWNTEGCGKWSNAELQPNGDLLVVGIEPVEPGRDEKGATARYVMRQSWDGDVLWKARLQAHHDVQPVPGGRLITLDWTDRRIPKIDSEIDVRDNRLVLLSSSGKVLESKSLLDLMSADSRFAFLEVGPGERNHDRKIDLFHANSVEWLSHEHLFGTHELYSASRVLVSIRHQNAIAVIDWDREELVWSWGQGELDGPHDASFLPDGNILVFDNGLSRRWSRILEIDPRKSGDPIVWRYQAEKREEFYSAARGSSQRLPNGNTLIAESDRGRAFEVSPGGETVWSWRNPHLDREGHRATIVRIERYLRDESGALVALEPPYESSPPLD